jgi:hypothetical protein
MIAILGLLIITLIDIIVNDDITRVRAIFKARDQEGPDDCEDPRAGWDGITKPEYRGERRGWQEDYALNVLMAHLGPYPPMKRTSVIIANCFYHYDREPLTRVCYTMCY